MITCSGTQYHLHDPTSDMETSLANITKLLENLTTRMNDVEQEVRNTRNRETTDNISDNGPRPEPRQANFGLMTKMILQEQTLRI